MIARTPREITVGDTTPVLLNDTAAMPATSLSAYYTGGNIEYSPDANFEFGEGFPLLADVVQNIPAQNNIYALSEAGDVPVRLIDFEA